jgi:hypothetical protein
MNRCEFGSRTLGQERKRICSSVVEIVYNRDPAATSSIQTKKTSHQKERPILIGETTDIYFWPPWFLLAFFCSNDILASRRQHESVMGSCAGDDAGVPVPKRNGGCGAFAGAAHGKAARRAHSSPHLLGR